MIARSFTLPRVTVVAITALVMFIVAKADLGPDFPASELAALGVTTPRFADDLHADATSTVPWHDDHGPERAVDSLRKKFGSAAVIRGIAYEGPEKAEE